MAPSYNFLTLIGPLCLILISGTESLTNNDVTVQLACSSGPHTCADVQGSNPRPVVTLSNGLEVVCDTVTDNGGWVVMQRRASADVDFYLNWVDYKYGFGDVYGNFWLGLEKVHQLTFKRRYELRVDISFNGQDYYANYDNFTLFGEAENYRIRVSGYSGNSSNGLSYHNDQPFTTKDRDNDAKSSDNCAVEYHGAWWYKTCHNSNLNGKWGSQEYGEGLVWGTTTGQYDSATLTEMKIRPLD